MDGTGDDGILTNGEIFLLVARRLKKMAVKKERIFLITS